MKCQDCECEGMPCFLADDAPDDPNGIYCAKHAFTHGFCAICGQFWGGIESFDFGPGYCENCASQIDTDDECEEDDFDCEDLENDPSI